MLLLSELSSEVIFLLGIDIVGVSVYVASGSETGPRGVVPFVFGTKEMTRARSEQFSVVLGTH